MSSYFTYSEFSENGAEALSESGPLYGLALAAGFDLAKDYTLRISLQRQEGQNHYDGKTQIGSRLLTTTNQKISSVQLSVTRELGKGFSIGLASGYNIWSRAIRKTQYSPDLDETYDWYKSELEVTYAHSVGEKHHIEIWGGVSYSHHAKVEVDLVKQGYGKPVLSITNKPGFISGLSYAYAFSERNALVAKLTHEYYEFGRGEEETITNGTRVYMIHEPASETGQVSFRVGIKSIF